MPPVSGAVAALRKSGGVGGGKGSLTGLKPPQRCDYKTLAVECFAKLDAVGREMKRRGTTGTGTGAGTGTGTGGAEGAYYDLQQWTIRLLKQNALDPAVDGELYQRLHACLDEVDRVDASALAYHCRLCLGLQTRGGGVGGGGGSLHAPATMNKCGHRICPECARGLLDDALRGHVPIPVTCPVGCAGGAGMEARGNGQGTGTLRPAQARHLLDDEPFERFKRLYDVKTSLAQSAPHSRSSELQKSLKEAQDIIAKSREAAKLH